MRIFLAGLRAFVFATFAAFCLHGSADAQTTNVSKIEARLDAAAKKIQSACSDDVKNYCNMVTPGEGRLMLCMMAHEDKISTKCDYSLYEASRNLERALNRLEEVADACWNAIEKYCANVPEGGGRIAGCLITIKASLTRTCRAALAKVPKAN